MRRRNFLALLGAFAVDPAAALQLCKVGLVFTTSPVTDMTGPNPVHPMACCNARSSLPRCPVCRAARRHNLRGTRLPVLLAYCDILLGWVAAHRAHGVDGIDRVRRGIALATAAGAGTRQRRPSRSSTKPSPDQLSPA